MARVEIKNLVKTYQSNTTIFDKFSITFEDGEFIVILGPSGCGKSTLLRSIAGLETVQSGEILVDGRNIVKDDPKDRDMAMVFQNYALYPHKTVYGNLEFGLKMRGISKSVREDRIKEVAEIIGLKDYLNRKPRQLSGGQKQRVALGRALVNNPNIFLMDEPLSNLDAKLRLKMRSEIIQLYRRLGKSMIYVTHDQVEAMTMASRILLLNNGKIQQFDTPDNLYHQPANLFTAQFMGTPQMNVYLLPVKKGQVEFANQFYKIPVTYTHDEIYLGIRAEDININPRGPFSFNYAENLGNESLIYLKHDLTEVVIRTDETSYLKEDNFFELTFLVNKIHWFDALSEKRIN